MQRRSARNSLRSEHVRKGTRLLRLIDCTCVPRQIFGLAMDDVCACAAHKPSVIDGCETPGLTSVNTILGDFEYSLHGTYHAVAPRYTLGYLAEFQCRFNRRCFLAALPLATSDSHLCRPAAAAPACQSDRACQTPVGVAQPTGYAP